MREEEMDGGVHQKILEISQLPSTAAVAGEYGNVRYLAQQLLSPWRDWEISNKTQCLGLVADVINACMYIIYIYIYVLQYTHMITCMF